MYELPPSTPMVYPPPPLFSTVPLTASDPSNYLPPKPNVTELSD